MNGQIESEVSQTQPVSSQLESQLQEEHVNAPAPAPLANNRRIYAEDPEWNILSIKKLSDLCLDVLVAHFESMFVLCVCMNC